MPASSPAITGVLTPEGIQTFIESLLGSYSEAVLDRLPQDDAVQRCGRYVAGSMLDFQVGYAGNAPGDWTRDDIEGYFLDYFPRQLSAADEIVDAAPACACSFLRFLDDEGMLSGEPLPELARCCSELSEELGVAKARAGKRGSATAAGKRTHL